MVNSWPSLVHRARLTGRLMSDIIHRPRLSAKLLGEVALGVLLVSALAFSPRDGVPTVAYDDAWTTLATVPYQPALGNESLFGQTLPALRNLSGLAKAGGIVISSKALIPTTPPAQLVIPALNVHRPVEGVGTNRFGVMNLPVNGWNAGWYKGGPIPGAPGDAVIEGHAGFPGQPMMFGKLDTLRPGDKIFVVESNGTRRLFLVVSMTVLPVGAAPAGFGQPYGLPRLTLVTCTGHFDQDTFSYNKRLVVEASYAGIV